MAELGLLHCWSTFPAVPRENARKTDKALVKLISKITKINYPDGILSSFEEIGRLPGPPPFRLDPGAVRRQLSSNIARNGIPMAKFFFLKNWPVTP